MVNPNLPTDALRTLVMIVDLGSFTKAGNELGRTQPAISLQIRRLEEIAGGRLLDTSGRTIRLTARGELLVRYSRQLLCINDEAMTRLQGKPSTGTLRIGLPVDYAVAFFQDVLTKFLNEHPDVALEIICDRSVRILQRLAAEELDIAVAMYEGAWPSGLAYAWAERPIWVTASGGDTHRRSPVPIACHNEGCEYRNRMVRALDLIGKPWRVTYSSPGISGLQNAILAGFGVSALTKRTLVEGMRVLGPEDGFPMLPDVHLGLHYKASHISTAGTMLVGFLMRSLQGSGQAELIRLQGDMAL